MADSRKVVRVFLASPGDLQTERQTAKAVVDEFNNLWSEQSGYYVELVGWEDTMPSFGRPQAIINRDLARCEFFIGMIWKRWGTPPDTSGPYKSGFEEEFQRSVISRRNSGKPEISLFFKDVDEDQLRDPGDELKKVLAFKNNIITEKMILFDTFGELQGFEKKIRLCITRYVQGLQEKEASGVAGNQSLPMEEPRPQAVDSGETKQDTMFSADSAKFLRQFMAKAEHSVENQPIQSAEVARFRLLGRIIGIHGNDEQSLGVHDANLLFANRSAFKLDEHERFGLITSGLEQFSSDNTPLWHWVAVEDGFNHKILSTHSVLGTTAKRVGALSAMRLISDSLYVGGSITRTVYLNSWFSRDSTSELKVSAIEYLGECGETTDLAAIQAELERHDYKTEAAAIDAILRIKLRDSRHEAIRTLYDLQPNSVAPSLLAALFAKNIPNGTISEGLGHKSASVRRKAAKLLGERNALDIGTAERLISDDDPIVRFEGFMSLVSSGRHFSNEEAEKILVKKPANTSYLSSLRGTDTTGEECLARFGEQQLKAMADHELEEAARPKSIFNRTAEFVLVERQFTIRGNQLRAAVDDCFKREFDEGLQVLAREFGGSASGSDFIEKARSLEEYLRKDLTRKALDIICRKADPQDLDRVRQAIKSAFVIHSDTDIDYLRKIGEWEDIPLIISSIARQKSDIILLPIKNDIYRTAARAIYSLGRARFAELLKLDAPAPLLAHIIALSSDEVFRRLDEASLKSLFLSENDQVRKAAVLKSVRALTKKRLIQLLDSYIAGEESHYYNVIHWLDLGASLPKERAVRAAEKVLSREWKE